MCKCVDLCTDVFAHGCEFVWICESVCVVGLCLRGGDGCVSPHTLSGWGGFKDVQSQTCQLDEGSCASSGEVLQKLEFGQEMSRKLYREPTSSLASGLDFQTLPP